MEDIKVISTTAGSGLPEYIDFATLRKEGIDHIAAFSGKVWTDHNLHDPGITILEALCYVLTDLDYRSKLDFKDLVAKKNDAPENNFLTSARILGNNPLTVTDYRKLLIDINGVRNAWLEKASERDYWLSWNCTTGRLENTPLAPAPLALPVNIRPVPLNGLYKVYIEPDDVYRSAYIKDACGNEVFPMEKMLEDVTERLHRYRNLCEDFAEVTVLREEPISLCLHVESKPDYDPEEVLVQIFSLIQDFFSPAPQFYTLQQLLDKGRSMEEIFEGRPFDPENGVVQQNGFIDTQELEALQRHRTIYASDLYRLIMSVPGVAGITRLVMFSAANGGNPDTAFDKGEEWSLTLQEHHRPVLDPEQSTVIFFKNRLPFTVDPKKIKGRYIKNISDYNKSARKAAELDTIVPEGRQMDLAEYRSVQYEFPRVYNIGKHTVPPDASAERKAQALQLQGYLLFYDRLLADYFAQLSNIRQLFALSPASDNDPRHTYYTADLAGIPQLPDLLRGYQSAPGSGGAPYQGMPLAYVPDEQDPSLPRYYSSLYIRDEAIRRILNACANTIVKPVAAQDEEGNWSFYLESNEEIILRGLQQFGAERDAMRAARDVLFLAGLPSSYSRSNNRDEEQYSFEVVYNDSGYTEMITALYETDEAYYKRKEKFLDHLLARFSEDFTDYVLMMYALNGKRNDPAVNIRDKSNFLSAYPTISAYRSRAFNYMEAVSGMPVSGLQERVSRLIGIQHDPAASLNNFDIVEVSKGFIFRCNLPGQSEQDTPLFISRSSYPTAEQANKAYHLFLELAKNIDHHKKYGCTGENVYGFSLQHLHREENGTEWWLDVWHPVEYARPDKRDAVLEWLVQYFTLNRKYTQLIKLNQGYYFLLRNDKGQLLFRSAQGYETPALAYTACFNCLALLQQETAYRVWYRAEAASYLVEVIDPQTQPLTVLARHPRAFNSEAGAVKIMQQLQQFYRQKHLVYTEEAEHSHSWQLLHKQQAAWQSAIRFKNTDQLRPAFVQFLGLAAREENYIPVKSNNNAYSFEVVRKEILEDDQEQAIQTVIAIHLLEYPTAAAQEEAIREYAALFGRIWQTINDATIQLDTAYWDFYDTDLVLETLKHSHYFFKIKDKAEILLHETKEYDSLDAVRTAFYKTVQLGKHFENYQPFATDSCAYGFNIVDEQQAPLALHPAVYLNEQERDLAIQRVMRFLQEHGATLETVQLPGAWRYNWQWLSCCGKPETALEGLDEIYDEAEANAGLEKMMQQAMNEHHYKAVEEDGTWYIWLHDGENGEGSRLARHPGAYNCEQKAKLTIQRLATWALNEPDGLFSASGIKVFAGSRPGQPLDTEDSGFRLWDRDYRVARYYRQFNTAADRDAALQALWVQYQQEAPAYTVIYTEDNGQHGFRLFNPQTGIYEWDSLRAYPSQEAAAAGVDELLQLLSYSGNYTREDEASACRYTIAIGKVLLDIYYTSATKPDAGTSRETADWDRLNEFISGIPGDDGMFYNYTEHPDNCAYGFRMVNNDLYRVAAHTGWYHSTAKREKARKELLADINCRKELYSWVLASLTPAAKPGNGPEATESAVLSAEEIDLLPPCYFPQPELIDIKKIWLHATEDMPGQTEWQLVQEPMPAYPGKFLYYFQLVQKNESKTCKVIWRSVNKYADECEAKDAERYRYIYLLELARSAASYWYRPLPEEENKFTLSLKDLNGEIIAVAPGIICEEDLEKDRSARMIDAMLYPVMENGDGYSFEINSVWQQSIAPGLANYDYRTIWQGIRIFSTPAEAFEAFKSAAKLFLDLRNYQRIEDSNCGPFGIEITDPQQVIARHPLSYTTQGARDAAITAVRNAINAEGFHILEHLLLRPRQQDRAYKPLYLEWELPGGSDETAARKLRITANTTFDRPDQTEAQAFVAALQAAESAGNKIYIETFSNRYIVSCWDDKQVMIASSTLYKLNEDEDLCADLKTWLQEWIPAATPQDVKEEQVITASSPLLTLCPDEDICQLPLPDGQDPNSTYCDKTFMVDPYSFWATIVLPGWPRRFQSSRFRQFFEQTLRKEAPAHIRLRILWVSPQDMYDYEKACIAWLRSFAWSGGCDYTQRLEELTDVLQSMRTIFPATTLFDEGGDTDGQVILLDETLLGL
jgi:uncharacterized protein YegP (UPF0339 family)